MITADELAWKLQEEWILPLSQAELKAFDKLAKKYEKNKVSRAYSTGSGAAIVIQDNPAEDSRWQCDRCRQWNFRREWSIKNQLGDNNYCSDCLEEWAS